MWTGKKKILIYGKRSSFPEGLVSLASSDWEIYNCLNGGDFFKEIHQKEVLKNIIFGRKSSPDVILDVSFSGNYSNILTVSHSINTGIVIATICPLSEKDLRLATKYSKTLPISISEETSTIGYNVLSLLAQAELVSKRRGGLSIY